jgi:hypothetical protein
MTTLTTASWLHEADTICMLLESNGIKTFVPDQGTVTVQPFYSHAIGGIRVQVDENDLEEARRILESQSLSQDTGLFPCPECNSDSTEYQEFSRRFAFLSLLLLGIPLLLRKRKHICHTCGHKWKDTHNKVLEGTSQ